MKKCGGERIKIMENGPYMVFGDIPLKGEAIERDEEGRSVRWTETKKHYPDGVYALCRCGNSANKPFCNADHSDFDGTETAPRSTYDECSYIIPRSEDVGYQQSPMFCTRSEFCHGRVDVAKAAANKETLDAAIERTHHCAGGSVVINVDGKKQEPCLEKSISAAASFGDAGPLRVRGGIPVESSDGYVYEVRNRVALCRCGKSLNKPFCDTSHMR
ncbi:MAG: CDGSH iron-sulfur domain-containing protein [Candidatus Methanoplasma sp.]|jgi:CDGSH-type Zn-finger protein|nr:CDGSH iron-sulfur domain-containing protein [Candidatus Methanoplasma sp.]